MDAVMLADSTTAERVPIPPPPDVDAQVEVAQGVASAVAQGVDEDGQSANPDSAQRVPLPTPPPVGSTVEVAQGLDLVEIFPLSLKDAAYREEPDPTVVPDRVVTPLASQPLGTQDLFRVMREVATAYSGDDLYCAVSADEEFTTPGHPACQQRHFGLGFGIVLFSQATPHLGGALTLHQARSPQGFSSAFGSDSAELLAVTNRPDEAGRLAPVGGELLWSAPWLEKFRAAGQQPECQAAQNEQAIERQLRPLLPYAFDLGLDTDRTLAMAYDVVVARGLGGAIRWLVDATGQLAGAAQRDRALSALQATSIEQFRTSVGLPAAGGYDAAGMTRLVGRTRAEGSIAMPTAVELAKRLVGAAAGASQARLLRLAASTAFADLTYRPE